VVTTAALAQDQPEERTVNAFAAYETEGKVYLTGDKKGTFVGALSGPLLVDSDRGPMHVGRITCPGIVQLDMESGKLEANGRCTITAHDGAQVFAAWSCRGVALVGCDGTLTLTGGTERVTGISGSGPLSLRTSASGMVRTSTDKDSVTTLGAGVLMLRDFKLKSPPQ